MIPKSGYRFSEKIMLKRQAKAKQRLTQNHFALVQAAVHNAGILQHVVGRRCSAGRWRRRYRRGRRWREGSLRSAALNRCCRRRRLLLGVRLGVRPGLAVSDEFFIAGGARPRRHIGGQPAGPVRPMIGDKAAAAREIKSKSEQSCRCNEPLGGHEGCRMPGARVYTPIHRDG
jgi:hypothetical protein